MFDSAIELITQAASSSLFLFCLCNLIIAIILMSSKSSTTSHQDTIAPLSVVSKPKTGDEGRMKAQCPSKKHENSTLHVDGIGVSYATNNSDTEEKEGKTENHENNSPGSCEQDNDNLDGIGISYAANNSDTEDKEGAMENPENNSPGSCEEDNDDLDGIGVSIAANNSDTEEKERAIENPENNCPDSCEQDDDDLRRRSEEFIVKLHSEWRAEQSRIVR